MIESKINKDLERKIDLYVNGKLNEAEIDELWVELIEDEYYLDYTKSVANLKAVIERKRKEERAAAVLPLRKYINYGAAAAVALIIGVIGILNYPANNTDSNGIEAIDLIEYGINRSVGDTAVETDNEVVRQAINLANKGNTDEAIRILEVELSSTDDINEIAELSLTLGSIQYNYGNYEGALASFERVASLENIDVLLLDKSLWFLGNTYIQLDNLVEAEKAFQKAINLDKQYSRVAQHYLEVIRNSTE